MNCADVWEVTIVPSASSQVVSSNSATASSARVLNIAHENKRDSYLSEGLEAKREETHRNSGGYLETMPLSFTYRKSNRDNSSRPSNPNKQFISIPRGDEVKLNSRMYEKVNEGYALFQTPKDVNNESNGPFVELGAVCRILNSIADSDRKISSLTSCCNEISRTLQYLSVQRRDKNLKDLLASDSRLYKCERCGVISCKLKLRPDNNEIKENGAAHDTDVITAERDCISRDRGETRSEATINILDLKSDASSGMFANSFKVDRAKYKDESNRTESLPVEERAFATRDRIGSPNGANNTSDAEIDAYAGTKNISHLDNNTVKKLFTDLDAIRRDKTSKFNGDTRNDRSRDELSSAARADADIDTEKVLRKISYEVRKSQIDNSSPDRCLKNTRRSRDPFEKDVGHVTSGIDTVKYLARGQFAILDKEENNLFSKLQERLRVRTEKNVGKEESFGLHGSRDDCPQCELGFWLLDKSGRLPEATLSKHCRLPMPTQHYNNNNNNNGSTNDSFRIDTPRRFNARKKVDGWTECMERDSLENCDPLQERIESATTTFSSSSTENLRCEWIESVNGKDDINNIVEDLFQSHRLVSSRPSLDIARHVRAEATRNSPANKTICEAPSRDSNIFARLSPVTRRKIQNLIESMISSDVKDSIRRRGNLAIDALSSKKLLHTKSMDGTFAYLDKSSTDNKMSDAWNDYIPTKLPKLLEDKGSRSIKRQDDDVDACKRISKDFQILYEHLAASLDESEKLASSPARKVARRVIYKDASITDIVRDDGNYVAAEILSVYRKILENSEGMNWDRFRKLVEVLHPDQKELWRDICKTINEKTNRTVDDASAEICIEISPILPEETPKTSRVTVCAREIVFELDMTLKDVESFLNKRPRAAEERLDTHKDADKSITGCSNGRQKGITHQTR